MILYLSSTQHTNLLDFTGFYEPDSEMPVLHLGTQTRNLHRPSRSFLPCTLQG